MLTKILVIAWYHIDDDRVRLSVKDFELHRAFSMRLVIGKKKQFCFSAQNKLNPFFIILVSIVRLPTFSSHGSSVFCDVATIKTLDIVWNQFWKKEERRKKRRRGVFGKSQFFREKKNRKIKEEKKKQQKNQDGATREIWLSYAWRVSNIGLNFQKTFIWKKNKCIYGFLLELKSQAE